MQRSWISCFSLLCLPSFALGNIPSVFKDWFLVDPKSKKLLVTPNEEGKYQDYISYILFCFVFQQNFLLLNETRRDYKRGEETGKERKKRRRETREINISTPPRYDLSAMLILKILFLFNITLTKQPLNMPEYFRMPVADTHQVNRIASSLCIL